MAFTWKLMDNNVVQASLATSHRAAPHKKTARPVNSKTPHQFRVKSYDLRRITYKSLIHELGMESL